MEGTMSCSPLASLLLCPRLLHHLLLCFKEAQLGALSFTVCGVGVWGAAEGMQEGGREVNHIADYRERNECILFFKIRTGCY